MLKAHYVHSNFFRIDNNTKKPEIISNYEPLDFPASLGKSFTLLRL